MTESSDAAIFKVVVVGDSGVGKTSIVDRFCFNKFDDNNNTTIGSACLKKKVDVSEGSVMLNIWDTAGQERYQSLIPMYLRNAKACVIVIDLERPLSLDELTLYHDYLMEQVDQNCFFCLCANKIDVVRDDFNIDDLSKWASQKGCKLFRVSAKLGSGITDLFTEIALEVEARSKEEYKPETILKEAPAEETKCCF